MNKPSSLSSCVHVLHQRALDQGTRTAYTFLSNRGRTEQTVSYQKLASATAAVANQLKEAKAGARVLLIFPPGLDYIASFLGCLAATTVAVPLYPPRSNRHGKRLAAVVADCQPALALTTPRLQPLVKELLADMPNAPKIMVADTTASAILTPPELTPQTTAFLQYTSGSTGDPKGVVVTHGSLMANQRAMGDAFQTSAEDIGVSWLPMYHDMGLIGTVLHALYRGFPSYLLAPVDFIRDPLLWLRLIHRYRATLCGGPDFAYALCAAKAGFSDTTDLDLSSWRLAFNGAEPVRAETLRNFAQTFAPHGFRADAFYPCYGMAEATLFISGPEPGTGAAIRSFDKAALTNKGMARDGSGHDLVGCGIPVADHDVAIIDPVSGHPLPQGTIGEIVVRGPSIAAGYYRKPQQTQATFGTSLHGKTWLRTGDLGFMHPDGLFVTGRRKDLIIIRGRNHFPQDIEATATASHEALAPDQCIAFAITVDGDERLAICAEPHRSKRKNLDTGFIMQQVREAVAEEHQVAVATVVLVKPGGLPKTSSGKPRRIACREALALNTLPVLAQSEAQTQDPTRQAVLDTTALQAMNPEEQHDYRVDLLKCRVAGAAGLPAEALDDATHLSAAALDSIAVMELQLTLEQDFGATLPVGLLLENPSFDQLAGALVQQHSDLTQEMPPVRPTPLPLTFAQERLLFMTRLAPENPFYHIPLALRLTGPLNKEHLGEALTQVVEIQESMRTRIFFDAGQPVQIIDPPYPVDLPMIRVAADSEWRELASATMHRIFDEGKILWRACLFQLNEQEHILLLVFHHLIADGWSLDVLVRQLTATYLGNKVTQPTWQVADFAAEEGRIPRHHPEDRIWWRQQLTGIHGHAQLPPDKPRPQTPDYHGTSLPLHLPAPLISNLTRHSEATLFATLLAGFKTLLYRYSGFTDCTVGTFMANRQRVSQRDLIGYFANTVPLRTDLSGFPNGTPTFTTVCRRVNRTVRQALARQAVSFEHMVADTDLPRETGRNPLMDIIFVLQQAPPRLNLNQQLNLSPVLDLDWGTARFDLEIHLWQEDGAVRGSLVYATQLYEAQTIANLAEDYLALLHAMAEDRNQPIDFPILPNQATPQRQVTLEAALLSAGPLADCAVLHRGDRRVAYGVAKHQLTPTQFHDFAAKRLERTQAPDAYVILDQLPLRPDGELDVAALHRLPVVHESLMQQWTQQLSNLEGINTVSFSQTVQATPPPPLHRFDLTPPPEGVSTQSAGLLLAGDIDWTGPPALSDGGPLAVPPDEPKTLGEALVRTARRYPQKGVTYVAHGGSTRLQTYPQLLTQARHLLAGLRNLGLKPGDAAVLTIDDLAWHLPCFWACVLGGLRPVTVAVPNAFNADNSVVRKLVNTWSLLDQPVVLTTPQVIVPLQAAAVMAHPRLIDVTQLAAEPIGEDHGAEPDDVLFFQLTSGSTGIPKCIQETHRGIMAHIHGAQPFNGYSADDISLNWLPMDHVVPLLTCHLKDTVLGNQQIQVPTRLVLADPCLWPQLLERFQVTHSWSPNFGFKLVAAEMEKQPDQRWDLSHVKFLMNAGEQVTEPAVADFIRLLAPSGLREDAVQPAFGMAEVCTCMTWNNHTRPAEAFFRFTKASLGGKLMPAAENADETIAFADLGPPHPGVAIRIADAHNQVLPEDTIGRLQIKGTVVTPGYFRNPEANADAFVGDGWFNTGDLGLIHKGRLAVTGREKEMIIVHGANHYCYEIEDMVGRCAGVKNGFVAACSLPDEHTGSEALAVFFSPEGALLEQHLEAIGTIRERLAAGLGIAPTHVIPIPAQDFPKTTSGKIQRTRLKKALIAGDYRETQRMLDLHQGNAGVLPNWFYRVTWVVAKPCQRRSQQRVRIMGDPAGLGQGLLAALRDRAQVTDLEDMAWSAGPTPDHVVYLGYYQNGEDQGEETGLDLITLYQSLAAVRLASLDLTVVTSQGRLIGNDDVVTPAKHLLPGLLKTMAREAPWLRIRLVDLPQDAPAHNVPRLLAELGDPAAEPESAWRGNRRLVSRLIPAALHRRPYAVEPAFKQGGRYLVTGGLGGIGARVAAFLLQRYQAQLVLVGRSPLPSEQPYGDKAAERRYHRYQSLRSQGAFTYLAADITDGPALQHALAKIDFKPDGILHLAAVLEPRPLLEETPKTFKAGVAARVTGTQVLAGLLEPPKQGLFVSFSSVNGYFGGTGVAAYAASCSFADGFAEWLMRQQHIRAYGLAWSIWEQTGMSRGLPTAPAAALGFVPISEAQGMLCLEAALLREPANLLIGLDPTKAMVAARLTGGPQVRTARLQAHYTASRSLPTPFTQSPLHDSFGTRVPCDWLFQQASVWEERKQAAASGRLEKEIARICAEVLEVPTPGIHHSFFELGGHSLLLTRLHARLVDELNLQLTMVDLFQYPTIASLTAFCEQRPKQVTPHETRVRTTASDIAVIGMACRFPGANNPQAFWANLRDGVESIRFFSEEELADLGDMVKKPGYVCANPVLDDIETFDAAFFQINPKEAALLDPQQRIMLYLAWEALEAAGYKPGDDHGPVGLFAGVGTNTYLLNNIVPNLPVSGNREHFQTMLANDKDFAATRVAYKLNLRGPAMTVQTACSTSLVALHQACKSLRDGECDMALAGGVSIRTPQKMGYQYSEGLIFSPDGHCRAFDAEAGGTVVGNGGGLILLKPLEHARRDGDPILAVVKGSAINNDGAQKVGYTAPSVDGQAAVIRAAHRNGNIQADTIGYVEAHGTATPLGDPIEVAALTSAFNTTRTGFCALGSVKTNIGHLDTAAGVAGVIKTILAMQHKQLPPSLHFNTPNPNIDFGRNPFYVNDRLTEWVKKPHPRRAGISSFGIGGTNAHVVLEEAPEPTSQQHNRVNLLTLSAKTPAALTTLAKRYRDLLQAPGAPSPSDICHTTNVGRVAFDIRLAVAGADAASLAQALTTAKPAEVATQPVEVVFLFTGQGAQYQQMGRELYEDFPIFRDSFDRCDHLLRSSLEQPLSRIIWGNQDGLEHTLYAQVALFAVQYALARTWASLGIRPTAVLGHSVGEFAAAVEAGIMDLPDALRLLAMRARLMQCLPAQGAMIAVFASPHALQEFLEDEPEVVIAAYNGPTHTVLSGRHGPVARVRQRLKEHGIHLTDLSQTRAFHAPLLDPMLDSLQHEAQQICYKTPAMPFISGLTGQEMKEAPDATYWRRQAREPVLFETAMRAVLHRPNAQFLELGPHPVLSGIGKRLAGKRRIWLPSLQREQDASVVLLSSLGKLWSAGHAVQWQGLQRNRPAARIPAPTYPFQGKRHWLSPQPAQSAPSAPSGEREMTSAPHPPTQDRGQRILGELHTLMVEILKADPEDIGPDDSFMELGADSIVLVDATQAIEREYGISLKIRQFFEDTTDLRSLSAWLDKQLPPEAPAPPLEVQPTPQPEPVPPQTVTPQAPTVPPPIANQQPAGDLTAFMQQQLATVSQTLNEVVRQQLSVLQGQPTLPGTPTGPVPTAPPTPPKRSATAHVNLPVKPAEVAKTAGVRLKEHQQAHLDALVARFTHKTRGSKESVQQYRGVLADSRAAMGFRFSIKEMLYPIVGAHSRGSRIQDVDGNEYVDVTMGQGVNFYGHHPEFVTEALRQTLDQGIHLNPRSEHLGPVAEMICRLTGMDRVAMCNSGTEAVMTMMRLARAATGRNKIVIFEGSYHGHADHTLALPPKEADALHALPVAAGTPPGAVQDIIVLDYGTPESLAFIRRHAHQLAAVMAEPVQSRFPDLQPGAFLREVREITQQQGALLLFDEMLCGFRCHPGGAQAHFGIRADLATYGKIIGGGMPIGIVAGKAAVMDGIDGGFWQYGDRSFPAAERIFFGGTFCFHPMAMAAAHATLVQLEQDSPSIQQQLNQRTTQLVTRLNTFFTTYDIPAHIMHFGSLFRFSFRSNMDLLFYHLLDKGVYLWEGRNCFLSTAHSDEDIEFVARAVEHSVMEMRDAGFLPPHSQKPNLQPLVFPPKVFMKDQGTVTMARRPRKQKPAPDDARGFWQRHDTGAPLAGNQTQALTGKANRDVDFSLFYFGTYPSEASDTKYELLLRGARFADNNGFSAVWIPERHFHSFGGFSPNPSVVAAGLARETNNIEIRGGSVVLPLHNPIRVAEEWSVVDNLSNGRVAVAFASGWHPDDFVFAPDIFGEHRETMFREIETVRALWRGQSVRVHNGDDNEITVKLHPMPLQKELRTWITIVNNTDTFKRAGRMGAGVLTNLIGQSMENLAANIQHYRNALTESGFDPASGHVTVMLHTFVGEDLEATREAARQPFYDYLENCVGLFKKLTVSQGLDIDPDKLDKDDREFIMGKAYDRYVAGSALIGTPESCQPIVDHLLSLGVDEIACFVDFGVPVDIAAAHFPHLRRLRKTYQGRSRSTPTTPSADDAEEEPTGYPLSPAQKQLLILSRMDDAASLAYTDTVHIRLKGSLDVSAMQEAVATVVNRHDALRTGFGDSWEQQTVMPPGSFHTPVILLTSVEALDQWLVNQLGKPFDLSTGPLIRAHLLQRDTQDWRLVLATHHSVVDGLSLDLILHEICKQYVHLAAGGEALKPVAQQFAQYLAVQQQQLTSGTWDQQRRFWLRQFPDGLPEMRLPSDIPRTTEDFRGKRFSQHLNRQQSDAVLAAGRSLGFTPFMTLFGIFSLLLHKVLDNRRVVIGIPTAGRPVSGPQAFVGYCAHLLPIRTTLDSGDVTDFMKSARSALLEAFDHQDYPFAHLLQALPGGAGANAVNLTFNMDKPVHLPKLSGLETEIMDRDIDAARFDLSLNVLDIDGNLTVEYDYRSGLFHQETMERLAGWYAHLLSVFVNAPETPVANLSVLTDALRETILTTWNTSGDEPGDNRLIHQAFAQHATAYPAAPALENATGEMITYADLDQQTASLASLLVSRGVGPETVVGVSYSDTNEAVTAMLAILRAGGVYLPLAPDLPPQRLQSILADARATLCFSHADDLPVDGLNLKAEAAAAPAIRSEPNNTAYIIYTSGSTGRPKGVAVPHCAVMRLVQPCGFAAIETGDRFGQVAQLSFDAATFEIWGALTNGGTTVAAHRDTVLDPQKLGEWIRTQPIHHMFLTASLFNNTVAENPTAFAGMKTLLVGGEALDPPSVNKALTSGPPQNLLNGYGPTENTTFTCTHPLVPNDHCPIGRPIRGTTAFVVDRHFNLLPPGMVGELVTGGRGLASRYVNRPALTAQVFVPNPFSTEAGNRLYRTGDLVRCRQDGVIDFLGRRDDQVKIRGFRIEPGEIETVLKRHPQVETAAVLVGRMTGEAVLAAWMTPIDLDVQAVRAWLRNRLPEYMIPSLLEARDFLPLNQNGKLDRSRLLAELSGLTMSEGEHIAPRNRLEEELADMWCDILERPAIGVTTNFFDLGGHSLSATRVVSRVLETYGLNLPLAQLFEQPTIEALARRITDAGGTLHAPSETADTIEIDL